MKPRFEVLVDKQGWSDDDLQVVSNNDTSRLEYQEISTSRRHRNSHVTNALKTVSFIAILVSCFRLTICRDVATQQDRSSGVVLMLSRGQQYDVSVGSKLVLDCEFHMDGYQMFDSPTVWEKTQMDERTRVNIMAAVQEPFASTRRFEVSFETKHKPRHLLRLTIRDISLEDTGNYTCEIRGRKSSVLSHVTHVVHVRWPLQALYMTPDIDRETLSAVSSQSLQSQVTSPILLNERQALPIRCVVQSGCPSLDLTMRVGTYDVTSHFRRTEHPVVITGERGLRVMMCAASLWSWGPPSHATSATGYNDPRVAKPSGRDGPEEGEAGLFIVNEGYDGMALRCSAVPVAPQIKCGALYEPDVQIECRVRSRPGPTSLYWIVDPNETTVPSGDSINDHVTRVRDAGDGSLITNLILRQADADSFRKYVLVAENAIGKTTHDVDLLRGASNNRVPPTIATSVRRPSFPYSSSVYSNHAWQHQGNTHIRHQQPGRESTRLSYVSVVTASMQNAINGLHERYAASSSVLSGTPRMSRRSTLVNIVLTVAHMCVLVHAVFNR